MNSWVRIFVFFFVFRKFSQYCPNWFTYYVLASKEILGFIYYLSKTVSPAIFSGSTVLAIWHIRKLSCLKLLYFIGVIFYSPFFLLPFSIYKYIHMIRVVSKKSHVTCRNISVSSKMGHWKAGQAYSPASSKLQVKMLPYVSPFLYAYLTALINSLVKTSMSSFSNAF